MVIEALDLVKKYKNITAVDRVSLGIKEGEIFGLLGPNGAGKTTTISALLGLIRMDGGQVKIYGKEFRQNSRDIKRKIGYVPQEFAFFEELSAYDNVTYWGKLYGLKGNDLYDSVKETLDVTGLWDRRKSKAKTFSGGMKRRLNIACAIVHKPKILVMDEPTAGVDAQSRNNILEAVRGLNKNGTTVLYTSHYMEEIEAICDRVAIMDFGRVIIQGTIDEIIDSTIAEKVIRINFSHDIDEAVKKIKDGNIEGITEIKNDGTAVDIKFAGNFTNILKAIFELDIDVKDLSLEKPNLETVFLKLTGKKLRD